MTDKRSGKSPGGGRRGSGTIRESEHGIHRPRPSGAPPEIRQQSPRPDPGGGGKGGGKGSKGS